MNPAGIGVGTLLMLTGLWLLLDSSS